MMTDYPLKFFLNGEPLKCAYYVEVCRLTKTTEVRLGVAHLDAALRLLPEIEAAPSIDYVLRNWSKQDVKS